MTAAAPAVAVDAGSRYLRVARADGDGPPYLVDLPGTVPGEGLPTPDRVRGDRAAALAAACAAYRAHCGPPGRLVAVVPHGERPPPAGETGEPPPQLLGVPHAVLALLRHAGTPPLSPVLVCDLGGAGVSLARCVLTGGTWAVSGPPRHAPLPGGYGAAFDRAVLDGAGLTADDPEVLRLLALARAESGRRTEVALDRMVARPDRAERLADTVVHEVAGREITAGVVHRAFARLTEGLDRVLADAGPARTPVVAVGGAARSAPLVRHLADRLGLPVPLPDGTDPALAPVFGAALVAAGRVDAADRYPHAVAVRVHRTVGGLPRDEELVISPPGTLAPGGATVFAETGGERVRLGAAPAEGGTGREVQLLVRGAGTRGGVSATAVTVSAAAGDRFHVGVRVTTDGTAHLVLHPLAPEAPAPHRHAAEPVAQEIPLGALPADPAP
ncbi:FGGY-family carbohydrate kinase [Streptomyces sp. DEF1AK]|uniref:FGGY-family carbohydrate kinase n=1 Tax=Streptomyces sp. DEF1AK TaxID=2759677 RepID=UPI001916840A|nr:FGGY-family carbohydrate kinase [Streptomyces sp. DEF1AK]MBK3390589.1 sugar kinase [Streptomyces sp. DEF1AK]